MHKKKTLLSFVLVLASHAKKKKIVQQISPCILISPKKRKVAAFEEKTTLKSF